jgi:hypothetical protein
MATKITNKLLKEAIADAKTVRETAIANAKLVLEEAIAPQVKEMIARRLRVEADMEHAEEEMEDTPALPKKGPEMEEATEKPHEDGEAVGSSEMPADSSDVGTGDNKQPSDDASDTSGVGDGGENVEDSHTDWYDDWDEADFDLGEIIKELENDIAALSSSEETEEVPVEEGEEPMEDEEEPVMEEKKHDDKEELKEEAETEEDEEVSLEEILAELEADEAPMGDEEDEKSAMMGKLAGLKNELAQYREAVNVLRGRLQEVNLLNAKLLFTNKLFRKEGLHNDQKIRIVESFDRATTVREVKLVYSAIVENLSVAAKTISTSRKKVVAEGLASKATPSTAPKSKAAEVIVENTVAKRLQQLAGII